MRRKQAYYLSMLLFAALTLHSCGLFDGEQDNPASIEHNTPQSSATNEDAISISGTVVLNGSTVTNGSYSINTILGETELNNSEFTIEASAEDSPQIIWMTDDDDHVLMLFRQEITDGQTIKIDEESTALALISIAPVFTNTSNEDFQKLVSSIKQSTAYANYFEILKEAITNRFCVNLGGNFRPISCWRISSWP